MTSVARRKEILRILQNEITVETLKLSEMFGVTSTTIRRDFDYFESHGLITTIYGGAMINTSPFGATSTIDMDKPDSQKAAEKREMARAAAALIQDGQTVMLDAGSSIKELAVELLTRSHITVLTNSILVMNVLAQIANNIRVFVLPGQFRKSSMAFFGGSTNAYMDDIHVDWSFIGVMGMSARMGGTVLDLEEGKTKAQMAKRAERAVILADHSKIGRETLISVIKPENLSILITGRGGDEKELREIGNKGVQVITM